MPVAFGSLGNMQSLAQAIPLVLEDGQLQSRRPTSQTMEYVRVSIDICAHGLACLAGDTVWDVPPHAFPRTNPQYRMKRHSFYMDPSGVWEMDDEPDGAQIFIKKGRVHNIVIIEDADDVYSCVRKRDGWWYGINKLVPTHVRFRTTDEFILYKVHAHTHQDY